MEIEKLYEGTLPREELDNLVDHRIRATVALAYKHVPFWKRKFDSLGIKPTDIKNRTDLLASYKKGLEVTNEELIRLSESLLPDYIHETYVEELWTAGTGGVPKCIYYTPDGFKRGVEQAIFFFKTMGLKPGDKVLSLLAPQPFASGIITREGAKEYNLNYLQVTAVPTPFLLQTIKRYKPRSLFALTTRAYSLPLELSEMGVDAKTLGIELVGVGAEASTAERRKKISEEWGAKVFDVWASSEASFMAVSCDKNCGMHIIENRSFITFVDPETKEEVSEGENGIDLVTTLYDIEERPGTILLNYSHGDVSEVLSFDECECGRTFKRIEHPSRQDEMVSVRGVKLCPRDVEPLLARLTDYFTGEYVAIYEFDEITRAPSLEIRLEAKKEIPGHIYSCLPNDVLAELFKSNPAALSVMFPQDIKTSVVRKGELYKGLDVKPSKPRRLIKIETNL